MDIEPLLTPKHVQAIFKCSLANVYKMVERGQLPCVTWPCLGEGTKKPRNMIRFKQSDIEQFIENHYKTSWLRIRCTFMKA